MFESTVHKFVKTVGSDAFTPASSVAAAENLNLLSLVERKASKWWLVKDKHYSTEFMLKDVLTKSDLPQVKIEDVHLCAFNKKATTKVNGKFSAQLKAIFEAELDNVETITIDAPLGDISLSEVDMQSLLTAMQGRTLNMSHEFVREMSSKKRRALCVVVGVARTKADCTIKATLNLKVSTDLKASIPIKKVASGDISGSVEGDTDRTLLLPAGTTLAYQFVELLVSDNGIIRVMVDRDSRGGFHGEDTVDFAIKTDQSIHHNLKGLKELSDEARGKLLNLIQESSSDAVLSDIIHCLKDCSAAPPALLEKTIAYARHEAGSSHNPANEAIRALCKALKDLDDECLELIRSLTVNQGQDLLAIIRDSLQGVQLTTEDKRIAQLLRDKNIGKDFLLYLGFAINSQGLVQTPEKGKNILATAEACLYGLFGLR